MTQQITAHSFMESVLKQLHRGAFWRATMVNILDVAAFVVGAIALNVGLWMCWDVVDSDMHPVLIVVLIGARVLVGLIGVAIFITALDPNALSAERAARHTAYWDSKFDDLKLLKNVNDLLPENIIDELRGRAKFEPLTKRDVREVMYQFLNKAVGSLHQQQRAILNKGAHNG